MNNDIEIYDEEESGEALQGIALIQSFFTLDGGVFIAKPNIAPLIDDDALKLVGQSVVEGYNTDLNSMSEWVEYLEAGRELVKQENKSRSTPWDGASNFKSPTITIAGIKFSDRASTELLRQDDIVKTKVIGNDDGGKKSERADRVAIYQNYQINEEMPEWREEQGKMISLLPLEGACFKKTYYDATEGRADSVVIRYPNFAVNQDTTSIQRMRRFSEVFDRSKDEVLSMQRQGVWVDLNEDESETGLSVEDSTGVENQTQDDKYSQFIEQQGFYDLDGDGYQEPYTFVVHRETAQVMRIIPRFDPENVFIKMGGQRFAVRLSDEFLANHENSKLMRIKPENNITKYGFIRDPQGKFLDVGFYSLLGAITSSINSTTNQLVDSGTLNNIAGSTGWLAKGFRNKMGSTKFKLGQFKETLLSAEQMRNGIMTLPVGSPSPVLFNLMQMLIASSQELSASADLSTSLGANAPATTTLALVQEQQQFSGAIILRMYGSMSEEFKKLFVLNSKYADPEHYREVVDDENANFEEDFDLKQMNVVPTANPEISSKIQRIQLAEVEMSRLDAIIGVGGDPRPVVRNFLEMIGSVNIQEIFPELDPMQRLQDLVSKNPELAEVISQEQQRAQMLMAAEQQAIQEDRSMQAALTASKLDKEASEIEKNKASTKKILEEAETENTKNLSNIYTTAGQLDKQSLENEALNEQRRLSRLEEPPNNQDRIN